MNIIIPNNILYLNNKSILVYIIIQLYSKLDNINYYIDTNNIIGFIYNTLDIKRAEKENIKNALEDLKSQEIISQYNPTVYIYNSKDSKVDKNYILLSYDIFDQLKTAPELLKHYIWIKKSMDYNIVIDNKRSVVSHMPIKYFATEEKLAEATIKKYNKQLQDMNLIYIIDNIYSSYENKDYADYWAIYIKHNQMSKSVASQYKYYCKDPNKYKAAEKEKLYSLIKKYNEDCILLGKYQPDYLKKIKDLDIFELF